MEREGQTDRQEWMREGESGRKCVVGRKWEEVCCVCVCFLHVSAAMPPSPSPSCPPTHPPSRPCSHPPAPSQGIMNPLVARQKNDKAGLGADPDAEEGMHEDEGEEQVHARARAHTHTHTHTHLHAHPLTQYVRTTRARVTLERSARPLPPPPPRICFSPLALPPLTRASHPPPHPRRRSARGVAPKSGPQRSSESEPWATT